jgi:hypothetical protein
MEMFVTPVLAALGLAGREDNVKGDHGGVVGDGAGVRVVNRVVRHEVAHLVKGEEESVDGHRHDVVIVFNGGVANKTAGTVYSNLDSCG